MTQVATAPANSETAPAIKSSQSIMAVLQSTKPQMIAALDFVKEKFVANYNICNNSKNGELAYANQMFHFNQAVAASTALQACDGFSLYGCFMTAAVMDWSLSPADNETYLIPRGGKAVLDPQAGAYVKRIVRTRQVKHVEQVKFVYVGDEFEFENGKVKYHKEKLESEIIRAAYVKYFLPDGSEKHFLYRKSDWEAWKAKSPQPNSDNWIGGFDKQPKASFLRTKVIKHSAKDKTWPTGNLALIPTEQLQFINDEAENTASEVVSSTVNDSFTPTAEEKVVATIEHKPNEDEASAGF